MKFIFDIDGTLTPARERMTKEHASKFSRWMKDKRFYLITGSDLVKTIAQVPLNIMGSANFTFCCLGNVLYEPINDDHYSRIRNHSPKWSAELLQACQGFVDTSAFEKRCGNHIERRIGVLNVSAVGRKASKEERQKYSDWDLINKEREAFTEKINETFDDYEASIGGMISIDITATGMHKGQILDDIDGDVVFFGDRIANGGNDYPLADRIEREERGVVHAVSEPEETIDILLGEYSLPML